MLKYEKDIVAVNDGGIYSTTIAIGNHTLIGDEPLKAGGKDLGPTSHQLLLASLGNCTAITLRMYAQHKQWDVKKISVHLNLEKVADPSEEKNIVHLRVEVEGNLTDEQRERLMIVAGKCPIHKFLTGKIEIRK